VGLLSLLGAAFYYHPLISIGIAGMVAVLGWMSVRTIRPKP